MMDRQAQRLQAAESIRQSACAAGNTQECSTATASWQSEMDLYRSLQAKYQHCILQSRTPYRFSQYNRYFSNGLRTDPLSTEWSYTEQIW